MDIKIDIRSEQNKEWQRYKNHINAKKFIDITRRTIEVSGVKSSWHTLELAVLLSDDKAVMNYNTQFRNVHSPTNVLSFPSAKNLKDDRSLMSQKEIYLGDIILSFGRIKTEALALEGFAQFDEAFIEHTYFMFIHAVLHLLGYSHDDEESQKEMEQLEANVLKK